MGRRRLVPSGSSLDPSPKEMRSVTYEETFSNGALVICRGQRQGK
jgi:hypothetical protein